MGLPPRECDGDVLVVCPGGWLTFAIDPERQDCRAEGKRCVGPLSGDWFSCETPLGACDPSSYEPECQTQSPHGTQGNLTVCSNGEILPSKEWCDPARAAPSSTR